jgi:cell division protein FtsL
VKRRIIFYFLILSIPLLLALSAAQASRYRAVAEDLKNLEAAQQQWLESNKKLIAGIAVLSSPQRIEQIARTDLGLKKKPPEQVLQIHIENGKRNDG